MCSFGFHGALCGVLVFVVAMAPTMAMSTRKPLLSVLVLLIVFALRASRVDAQATQFPAGAPYMPGDPVAPPTDSAVWNFLREAYQGFTGLVSKVNQTSNELDELDVQDNNGLSIMYVLFQSTRTDALGLSQFFNATLINMDWLNQKANVHLIANLQHPRVWVFNATAAARGSLSCVDIADGMRVVSETMNCTSIAFKLREGSKVSFPGRIENSKQILVMQYGLSGDGVFPNRYANFYTLNSSEARASCAQYGGTIRQRHFQAIQEGPKVNIQRVLPGRVLSVSVLEMNGSAASQADFNESRTEFYTCLLDKNGLNAPYVFLKQDQNVMCFDVKYGHIFPVYSTYCPLMCWTQVEHKTPVHTKSLLFFLYILAGFLAFIKLFVFEIMATGYDATSTGGIQIAIRNAVDGSLLHRISRIISTAVLSEFSPLLIQSISVGFERFQGAVDPEQVVIFASLTSFCLMWRSWMLFITTIGVYIYGEHNMDESGRKQLPSLLVLVSSFVIAGGATLAAVFVPFTYQGDTVYLFGQGYQSGNTGFSMFSSEAIAAGRFAAPQ